MVHEIENRIQQKVIEADALPVAWRKDQVWQKIARPVRPRRTRFIYYAAAVFLIAGFAILYSLQLNRQGETERTIRSLELLLAKELREVTKNRHDAVTEVTCAATTELASASVIRIRNKRSTTDNKSMHTSLLVAPTTETRPSEVTIISAEQDTKEETAMTSTEISEVLPPVQAIVGYIPPPRPTLAVLKKNRKSRVHFLKAPSPEPDPKAGESSWIVARIN